MRNSFIVGLAGVGLLVLAPELTPPARAQRVVNVEPAIDSQDVSPTTSISGLFRTPGETTVDPRTVKVFVNDTDVTGRSTIDPNFFSYKPDSPLPSGENNVRVTYQGNGGEKRTVRWNFTVRKPAEQLDIDSVTHNAASEALGAGATFLVTIEGTPGARGSVLLVTSDRVRTLPAQEVSSGIYVATLAVGQNDNFDGGVAVGRLTSDGQVLNAAAPESVQFSGATAALEGPLVEAGDAGDSSDETADSPDTFPLRPAFTSHTNGDSVRGGFTIVGQTQPNATVAIEADASRPLFGGLASLNEDRLVDTEVIADDNGKFRVQVPQASTGSGTRYTVRATASKDGTQSQVTQITLVAD
ncbi:hypothetical protein KR51_00023040 [Rubidibacter lacunae KORDI 51-2]|uniref:Bacterial Ig-like domain-containing protein n=1 Tax=Rubidibacter lacunae KORDI 51-2 TaxID=582515 RepID=U5DJE5_9CHRO|nr:hypothetical protein [Rubidibacter lacunae]ERN41047.1 hypothetical protein KR51_00023040 [Rubidibacter lacunae KORDI 51-2]